MHQQETLVRNEKLKITKSVKGTMLIGLGLGLGRMSHRSVETVMIAHRLSQLFCCESTLSLNIHPHPNF